MTERLDQTRTDIFYSASHHGIHTFSLPTPYPPDLPILVQVSPFHPQVSKEKFLYSEAQLEELGGLVAVAPCKGVVREQEAVVGLLLLYANGARRCVGQVRFDSMLGTLDVSGGSWCVGRDVADNRTIASVDVFPPRASGVD